MQYFKKITILAFSLFILISCKKAGGEGSPVVNPPANLVLSAIAATDGSGKVTFTATATYVTTYEYEFGNGEVKTVASGATEYQYTTAGTNTYTVTVTAKNNAGASIKKSIAVTVTVTTAVPALVWSEEFNVNGAPDPAKWGYDLGAGGWGNNELEYYTGRPENAIVQDGVLKIKAIKETYSGSPYTSARLLSKDKFAFKYGKVEVRAKIPAGVGTWPAIWMLGADIGTAGWPACGEIDIMEHRGSELNKIFGTLHYPGRSGGNANGNTKMVTNATTEFHLYSIDWSATAIKIYVDDVLYHTVPNSAAIPFNHDFFFILNVAIGGSFAGAVDPTLNSAIMEVDYIRVYK